MSDKLRNLLVRTASGVVLLGVVLGASIVGYWGFAALMMLITVVGLWEFYNLAVAKGTEPQRWLGIVASAMLVMAASAFAYAFYDTHNDNTIIISVAALLAFFVLAAMMFVVEVFRAKETPLLNIATTAMGVVYVAMPLSLMCFVPILANINSETWNPWAFLCYLFIVWGNDVFAYLVGISIGKHKMCPRLSPKKSWEGFFGGVLGSLAMGAFGAYIVDGNYLLWIGLAAVVSLSSVVGDLAESMFKRDAGVKDSGNFIPGHGGMLDRFDALILSAPFAFIYLIVAVIFFQ